MDEIEHPNLDEVLREYEASGGDQGVYCGAIAEYATLLAKFEALEAALTYIQELAEDALNRTDFDLVSQIEAEARAALKEANNDNRND